MMALVRREAGTKHGWIGTSRKACCTDGVAPVTAAEEVASIMAAKQPAVGKRSERFMGLPPVGFRMGNQTRSGAMRGPDSIRVFRPSTSST